MPSVALKGDDERPRKRSKWDEGPEAKKTAAVPAQQPTGSDDVPSWLADMPGLGATAQQFEDPTFGLGPPPQPPANAIQNAAAYPPNNTFKILKIPKHLKSGIIGKGGHLINYIRAQTQADIKIKDPEPGEDPNFATIRISGNVEKAETMILEQLKGLQSHPLYDDAWDTKYVEVPQNLVPLVIGPGGKNLHDIMEKCGCLVRFTRLQELDDDKAQFEKQHAMIKGPSDSLALGVQLVKEQVEISRKFDAKRTRQREEARSENLKANGVTVDSGISQPALGNTVGSWQGTSSSSKLHAGAMNRQNGWNNSSPLALENGRMDSQSSVAPAVPALENRSDHWQGGHNSQLNSFGKGNAPPMNVQRLSNAPANAQSITDAPMNMQWSGNNSMNVHGGGNFPVNMQWSGNDSTHMQGCENYSMNMQWPANNCMNLQADGNSQMNMQWSGNNSINMQAGGSSAMNMQWRPNSFGNMQEMGNASMSMQAAGNAHMSAHAGPNAPMNIQGAANATMHAVGNATSGMQSFGSSPMNSWQTDASWQVSGKGNVGANWQGEGTWQNSGSGTFGGQWQGDGNWQVSGKGSAGVSWQGDGFGGSWQASGNSGEAWQAPAHVPLGWQGGAKGEIGQW